MLLKAVSKPALPHFQMDATRSHSTAVPVPCPCGLVACLWLQGMERRLWGCSPVTLALSSRTGHVRLGCTACDLWPALAFPHNASWQKKDTRLPMATAQEMKEQREFLKSASFCQTVQGTQGIKIQLDKFIFTFPFKTIYSAQHQCQHVLISQYLNIPGLF